MRTVLRRTVRACSPGQTNRPARTRRLAVQLGARVRSREPSAAPVQGALIDSYPHRHRGTGAISAWPHMGQEPAAQVVLGSGRRRASVQAHTRVDVLPSGPAGLVGQVLDVHRAHVAVLLPLRGHDGHQSVPARESRVAVCAEDELLIDDPVGNELADVVVEQPDPADVYLHLLRDVAIRIADIGNRWEWRANTI
jgi:hypothetical protein